ncbi:MAG TPA: alpha-galactosidase [Firmicutes bacterium]|nr:alpha-galactosidase [Bacillota bacterium]
MAKITFIGAGSFGFTRALVRDILTFPRLADSTITLMDINAERLAFAERAVTRIINEGGYPAKVETTFDRRKALEGADVVLVTILAGGVDVWRKDIEIPKQYGVDICIGDTRGPSGIFRALRTIPVMLGICRDMEELCPRAVMLNYTNPMAMLCRAMQRESKIMVTGLCHSVQGTARRLAGWIGADMKDVDYLCAGINHQAWYLEYKWKGEDAYPLLREAVQRPEIYEQDIVRNEMFLHLDYYVTESSGHNSEYVWWFRKRPDLIAKYCTAGPHGAGGEYARIVKRYAAREHTWVADIEKWFQAPLNLQRGQEYAAYIINALMGGEPFIFNGNVPNTNLIDNLPPKVCVEVPVLANRGGLHPIHAGALPPQCAALNNVSIAGEEMAVEAALTGNPRLVFQACLYDPLTAAVLSMAEIKDMVQCMLKENAPYLPQFKTLTV